MSSTWRRHAGIKKDHKFFALLWRDVKISICDGNDRVDAPIQSHFAVSWQQQKAIRVLRT
jgi:hypothetical protein